MASNPRFVVRLWLASMGLLWALGLSPTAAEVPLQPPLFRLGTAPLRPKRPHDQLAAFSPAEPLIAVTNGAGEVELWDTRTWTLRKTIQTPESPMLEPRRPILSLAFSGDGKLLAFQDTDVLTMVDVTTGNFLWTKGSFFDPIFGGKLVFSPDGTLLYTGGTLLKARTGEGIRATRFGDHDVAAIRPDNQAILLIENRNLVLGDLRTGTVVRKAMTEEPIESIGYSTTRQAWLVTHRNGKSWLRSGETLEIIRAFDPPDDCLTVYLSKDDKLVQVPRLRRRRSVSLDSDKIVEGDPLPATPYYPQLSYDGALALRREHDFLAVYECVTGSRILPTSLQHPFLQLPSDSTVPVLTNGQAAWSVEKGELLASVDDALRSEKLANAAKQRLQATIAFDRHFVPWSVVLAPSGALAIDSFVLLRRGNTKDDFFIELGAKGRDLHAGPLGDVSIVTEDRRLLFVDVATHGISGERSGFRPPEFLSLGTFHYARDLDWLFCHSDAAAFLIRSDSKPVLLCRSEGLNDRPIRKTSADGGRVAMSGRHSPSVAVFDPRKAELLTQIPNEGRRAIEALDIASDSVAIVRSIEDKVGRPQQELRVYALSGKLLYAAPPLGETIYAVHWDGVACHLITSSGLRNLNTGTLLENKAPVTAGAFFGDIALLGTQQGEIIMVRRSNTKQEWRFRLESIAIEGLGINMLSSRILCRLADGSVAVFPLPALSTPAR